MATALSLHSVGTTDFSLRGSVNPPASPAGGSGAGSKLLKLTRVAKQFEGVLLASLLQEVQKGMLDPSDAGLGAGSDTLRSLGTEAVAQALAQQGGLGIARMIINHYQRYLADDGS